MYTCTPFLPLRPRLLSLSTDTPGDLRNRSRASCPTAFTLPSTLRMILSDLTSTMGLRAVTTASRRSPEALDRGMDGARVDSPSSTEKGEELRGVYPTCEMLTK